MSKSLGNLVMVSNLLKTYTPDAVRLYLGNHHYRDSWEWNADDMECASQMAEQWRSAAEGQIDVSAPHITATREAVQQALADDLDTPKAVAALNRLCEDILKGSYTKRDADSAKATLRAMAHLFGMRLGEPGVERRVSDGWGKHLQRFMTNS